MGGSVHVWVYGSVFQMSLTDDIITMYFHHQLVMKTDRSKKMIALEV